MHFDAEVATGLAVAALAGMAVGIEREWSGHSTGPAARFAGVRTFLLLGVLGGLAGWLTKGGLVGPGLALVAGGTGLTVAAYVMAARRGGEAVDGTTEMAALVVMALGLVAGLGFPLVTSAIASVMVLALAEKSRIHDAVRRLGERELTAALQFAVLALVILPLLPAGPYGPFGSIRPRALWTVVLLFSALNFAGYLASRALGPHRGYSLSGLLGGLISSTAVTLQFSRRSREIPAAGRALASGVVGACTVLVLRVTVIAAVLNATVARALIPYLAPVLASGAVVFGLAYLRQEKARAAEAPEEARNPLGLWSALKMALAFQAVLVAVPFVQQWLGAPGVLASAAALGLTDVDALTYAMARLGEAPEMGALGARGIAVGILSNTVLKLAVALLVGRGDFRRVAGPGLAVLGAASGLGLWLAR
ncbi:MAG TPA: MgtC/SapB family protein [Gemmatimonadales bacterium]|nr:MgtC/SapB family protein [Gemmatimonadales bacterium]